MLEAVLEPLHDYASLRVRWTCRRWCFNVTDVHTQFKSRDAFTFPRLQIFRHETHSVVAHVHFSRTSFFILFWTFKISPNKCCIFKKTNKKKAGCVMNIYYYFIFSWLISRYYERLFVWLNSHRCWTLFICQFVDRFPSAGCIPVILHRPWEGPWASETNCPLWADSCMLLIKSEKLLMLFHCCKTVNWSWEDFWTTCFMISRSGWTHLSSDGLSFLHDHHVKTLTFGIKGHM